MNYYAYMLRCADGTFYCGYTNDVARREKVHNSGKGARYTRSRRPVKTVYQEAFDDKSAALRREYALKQLTHSQKEALALRYQQEQMPQEERENL